MDQPMLSQFFDDRLIAELEAYAPVVVSPTPDDYLSPGALPLLAQAEVIITGWRSGRIGPEELAAAPRLRGVVHSAGSVRSYLTTDSFDRGILVSSQAWANAVPVAEYTLAMILLSLKGVFAAQHAYRSSRASIDTHTALARRGAYRARVGLIGASLVGRRVIDLLAPFDLQLALADPTITAAEATQLGARLTSLDELMSNSDVVSLHAPWLPTTEGMIGRPQLAALPDGATFINTARGALVDQGALIDELQSGRIEAVLDVTWPEIPASSSPLWELPNVTLTPHLAGSSGNELLRLGASAVRETVRVLRGEPPHHEVDRDRFDHMPDEPHRLMNHIDEGGPMPEMATDRVTETGSNPFDHHHYDYSPWSFWRTASHSQRQHQLGLQAQACARQPEWSLGEECFLSELATVQADVLVLGERCYLAAGSYLTGEIRAGRDCTVNAFTVVRGQVELGDGVRIGAHTSILAFNHTMSDPDVEVFRQPTTSRGVSIGDDVWIGSHVVVVDGVTVGSKAMLAAGAVVTKDVPVGAVVGGNPARVLRWRVPPPGAASGSDDLGSRVVAWADRAREQIPDVLARSWAPELPGGQFLDQPGHRPSVRAQCDAIEIADLWLGRAPDQLPEVEQQNRLRGWQDPVTGLVPELDQTATPRAAPVDWHDRDAAYHVLCVGYALDLLGSSFPKPISAVSDRTAPELVQALDALPWRNRAWGAGAWVDMVGTALRWNLSHGEVGQTGWAEALFGWLQIHTDPHTGMWGSPRTEDGMLQVVNGCYRASRGTLAQFGMPFARPERVIDTVLVHSTEARLFAASRQNACNVLDVAHPLWLALKQTDYRRHDVEVLARRLLGEAIGHWTDGAGFGFQAPHSTTRAVAATTPGLQGTEMWSATIWLLADLCGLGSVLGYRPRGIHRPEPALHLSHRSS